MCGQCVLHSTGMTCPMNCPKTLRNGPCGGVRPDGGCEVNPEMRCVWLKGWERSRKLPLWQDHFNHLRPPVDNRLEGTSSWKNLVTGRDRVRLALQADIRGAALHGIENVCCLTGDDVPAGDEPEARRVFDLDGPQLVATARSLASGHYLSGRTIDPAPHLFIGAVENPGAPPYEYRVERALKKVEAGARFLQLQLCFHTDMLER